MPTTPEINVVVSQARVMEGGDLVYTFTRTGDLSTELSVNLSVSGNATTSDYFIAPKLQWSRLTGSNTFNVATATDGSVYIDGLTNNGSTDSFVTKYKADGTKAWTRMVGGVGYESSGSVATSADGSVYISGNTTNSIDGQTNSGNWDAFVTKYTADGTKVWTLLAGGAGWDSGSSVTTSADGSVYISGTTSGSIDGQTNNGNWDVFVTKYTADGTKVWSRMVGGVGSESGGSVATSSDGSVYISGTTVGSFDGQSYNGYGDVFVTKYTADGTKVWTRMVGGVGSESGGSVATSADGSVYISGTTSGSIDGQTYNGRLDVFVIKYTANGTKSWTRLTGGSSDDLCNSVATADDGSVYITGTTYSRTIDGQSNNGSFDSFVTKYTADGTKVWTRMVGGAGNKYGGSVATSSDGSVYIGGAIYDETGKGNNVGFVTKFFEPALSHVTFVAGSDTATLIVHAIADQLVEVPETLTIEVLASDGYSLGTNPVATGTIVTYHSTPVAENSKTVTTLAATDALLGTAPKYALTGADASLFKVSSKGVLTFATVPDYEQPVDANHDGVYAVAVTMTNAKTGYQVVRGLTVGVEFVPINGTTVADTLKGTAGWDTLDGLGSDDKITGGAGLDTFLISSGRDIVLDFNALTKGATGSEVLQVSEGATADAILKAPWTATSNSFNDGTANLITKGMAVDLLGITEGLGWNVTNKGAATTITGSLFNDVLTGGNGSDILLGGLGNDVLAGGKGADFLTGGDGDDTFRFGGDIKTDHITDFLSGTDRIELDNLVFKTLLTEGQLAADQFVQGTTATTATQRIVYDQPTGNLWYDVDGSGKKAAVLIGVLDNHVQIAHTDFWVI